MNLLFKSNTQAQVLGIDLAALICIILYPLLPPLSYVPLVPMDLRALIFLLWVSMGHN
jgi:hypothetical protein